MGQIKKIIFIVLGMFFVIMGVIGIFLPILPTTPFLLLAAFFFLRSSEKLYKYLIGHKVLGSYIYSYTKYKAITKSTKIKAITIMWIGLAISSFFIPYLWVKILVGIIGIGVTIHLLRLKTLTDEQTLALNEERKKIIQ